MKNCKNILFKVWLVLTIAIVLGGIVLLSVLGFNNTVDFSKGYELTVGVEHKVDNQDVIPEVAEAFLSENGIANEKYSKVFLNDGTYVVYKFDDVVEIDKEALKTKVEEAVNKDTAIVSVEFNEFKTNRENNALFFVLALLIASVVIFLFTLILGKGKIALITFVSSVVSVISYLGMVSLFRVPVCSFLGVFTTLSFLFAFVLSAILAFNFRQIQKLVSNEKVSAIEVAKRGVKSNLFKFILIAIVVLISSIAMLAFAGAYFRFVAIHLILSSVSAFAVSIIGVPFAWTVQKKK